MKRLIITLVCAAFAIVVSAQQNGQQRAKHEFSPERYRQNLEEFVKREAGLTEEEAQKVLPLLHEMFERQRKNNDEAREAMRSCGENASEADYERAVTKALSLDVENKKLEGDYYHKIHKVLTWKKIHAVRVALWKFQREVLRRFTPQHERPQHRHK